MTSLFLLKKKRKANDKAMKMKRFFKSRPKLLVTLIATSVYFLMVDINLQQRARLLLDHQKMRDLMTLDLGAGKCDIQSPTGDANKRKEGATTTLLASYPGSGKVSTKKDVFKF